MRSHAEVARQSRPFAGVDPAWVALLIAGIILAAAGAQQIVIGLDTDVSWLITVGERMLAGDRLYVDIFELNPPASVLIYLPAIRLAHGLGLRPELVVAALTFALAAASLVLTVRIFGESSRSASGWMRLPIAVFSCFLLPGASFAQREHIAMLSLLPLIAACAVRDRRRVPPALAVLAGIGGGITASIKPHFLLAIIPLFLLAAWRRKSWRILLIPEAVATAAVVLLYGAAVVLFFPEFLSAALPLIRNGYLQQRVGLLDLLSQPGFLLFAVAALLTLFLERRRLDGSTAIFLLIAAVGFALAMLLQGKGYANHLYPALALAVMALGCSITEHGADERPNERRIALAGLTLAGSLGALLLANGRVYPEAAAIVERSAPPRPSVLVAGSNLSIGHPLTRWVGGTWAGTRGALWATATAAALIHKEADPARRAQLEAAIAKDRRLWVGDVARHHPDVILVDGHEGWDWIQRNSDVRAVMMPYRVVGSAEGVIVMVRRR